MTLAGPDVATPPHAASSSHLPPPAGSVASPGPAGPAEGSEREEPGGGGEDGEGWGEAGVPKGNWNACSRGHLGDVRGCERRRGRDGGAMCALLEKASRGAMGASEVQASEKGSVERLIRDGL